MMVVIQMVQCFVLLNVTQLFKLEIDGFGYEEKYLGQTKSSGTDTLFSYSTLKETFFLYSLIEKEKLYLSMVFDHTSTNIIRINFRYNIFRWYRCWFSRFAKNVFLWRIRCFMCLSNFVGLFVLISLVKKFSNLIKK
jgi:hypothetical protein